jgi:hypothetical protein
VVGAEESLRIEAGAATRIVAAMNRETPNASHATGVNSTQFCQNMYGKPGALFSVNRLLDAEAEGEASLASVSSAERWSGIPEPTNMRLPNGWGATETGATLDDPRNRRSLKKWFSA